MRFWEAIGECDKLGNDKLIMGFFCVDLFFGEDDSSTKGFLRPDWR